MFYHLKILSDKKPFEGTVPAEITLEDTQELYFTWKSAGNRTLYIDFKLQS